MLERTSDRFPICIGQFQPTNKNLIDKAGKLREKNISLLYRWAQEHWIAFIWAAWGGECKIRIGVIRGRRLPSQTLQLWKKLSGWPVLKLLFVKRPIMIDDSNFYFKFFLDTTFISRIHLDSHICLPFTPTGDIICPGETARLSSVHLKQQLLHV